MRDRQFISSGTVWETQVGYSRAVRVGNLIEVSGTTSTDGKSVIGVGDPYSQAKFILQKIEAALQQAGARLDDVIRTRIYVTDIRHWPAVGKAHGETFSEIRPASSLVEVGQLVAPELLVEIEATAILSDDSGES